MSLFLRSMRTARLALRSTIQRQQQQPRRSRWWGAAAGASVLCGSALGLTNPIATAPAPSSSSLAAPASSVSAAAPSASSSAPPARSLSAEPRVQWLMYAAEARGPAPGSSGGDNTGFVSQATQGLRQTLSRYPTSVIGISAVNLAVYGLWHVPGLVPTMEAHFAASPEGLLRHKRYHTLLTSVFSHAGILHLGMNSWALGSFAAPVNAALGGAGFVSFYLTAGVVSSVAGQALSVLLCRPSARALTMRTNSLGASGAVFAVLGMWASLHPDQRVSIIFIPGSSFNAQSALYGMMAFDVAGLLYGLVARSPLGHGAHLGGALFGLAYYEWAKTRNPRVMAYEQRVAEWRRRMAKNQAAH